jgi:hypothetical protein
VTGASHSGQNMLAQPTSNQTNVLGGIPPANQLTASQIHHPDTQTTIQQQLLGNHQLQKSL